MKLLIVFLISTTFVFGQKIESPPKPENLTFSHLIKVEVNDEGKLVYLRKSSNDPLNSIDYYNIIITVLKDNTDIIDSYIHTNFKEKGIFNDGYKTGLWKTTYKNKIVKIENWNNGLLINEYKVYNTTGELLYETDFGKQGIGKYKDYYYVTEILKEEGYYLNGKKEGEWCSYNESGHLINTIFYKAGELIRE